MGIQVSMENWIVSTLEKRGWKRINYLPLNRKRFRVLTKGSKSSVVVPSVPMHPERDAGSYQKQFDKYLRELIKLLENLHKGQYPISDMYFTGGGQLQIPDWFVNWCKERGITIHIVDPLEVPSL